MKTIERVYITRGDNLFDYEGRTCDKAWGVVVDGKIYWCDKSFTTIDDLEHQLFSLDIMVRKTRGGAKWGQLEDDGCGRKVATVGNNVTKISKHQDEVFSSESNYIKRAVKNGEGSYWWSLSDLVNFVKG